MTVRAELARFSVLELAHEHSLYTTERVVPSSRSSLVHGKAFPPLARTMGKDGKNYMGEYCKVLMKEMGVPHGTLLDSAEAAADRANAAQPQTRLDWRDAPGGSVNREGGKRKDKSDRKEKKRKEAAVVALTEGEAAKRGGKKKKVGQELATHGEGGAGGEEETGLVLKARGSKDESWDKKIEGQKFGEWR